MSHTSDELTLYYKTSWSQARWQLFRK